MSRAAQHAGPTGRRITGHSARRGVVVTGRKKGKRVEKLRAQGGRPKKSPAFREYADEDGRREDNAIGGIGL